MALQLALAGIRAAQTLTLALTLALSLARLELNGCLQVGQAALQALISLRATR